MNPHETEECNVRDECENYQEFLEFRRFHINKPIGSEQNKNRPNRHEHSIFFVSWETENSEEQDKNDN